MLPGFYFPAWQELATADSVEHPMTKNLNSVLNLAFQHYNRAEYKLGLSMNSEVSTLATLEDTKYRGLAPTIDWKCKGHTVANGLARQTTGNSENNKILSGWSYYDVNANTINTMQDSDTFEYFRFGAGGFETDPERHLNYMKDMCQFAKSDVVYYCKLTHINNSDYLAGSGRSYTHFNPDTLEHTVIPNLDKVKEKYKDNSNALVVENFYAYDNSSNASGGSRSKLTCDNWGTHYPSTPYIACEGTYEGTYESGVYPLWIPVWGLLYDGCSPNYGAMNMFNQNTPKLCITPYLQKYGYFTEQPLLVHDTIVESKIKKLDFHVISFNLGSEEEYHRFFNSLGLKVTFIQEEAERTPTELWSVPPDDAVVDDGPVGGWEDDGDTPQNPGGFEIVDPETPDTPERPTESVANGNGGIVGGNYDNEQRPVYTQNSDIQEDGSACTTYDSACTSWVLNPAELNELNRTFRVGGLWDNLGSWFSSPRQAIVSVLKFPFSLPNVDSNNITVADDTVIIAGVSMIHDAGVVTGRLINTKFKTRIKIGSFKMPRFFGSFLDYAPHTAVSLILPYIGKVTLSPDYLLDKTCEIYYNVSWIDGSCIAILKYAEEDGGHIISTWSGQLGANVPIVASDTADQLKGIVTDTVQSAVNVATTAMTGGANVTGAVMNGLTTASSNALSSIKPSVTTYEAPPAIHAKALPSVPYLVYERPRVNMLSNHPQIRGIATNIYKPLKDLAGFTMCTNVKLDNIPRALASEIEEIKEILKTGCILGKPKQTTTTTEV